MTSWVRRNKKKWLEDYRPKKERPSQQEEKQDDVRGMSATTSDPEVCGVVYRPLKCTKCNSKDIKCYSTRPGTRYYICRKCNHKFKVIIED